jgi:hypothetical protein
LSDCYKIDLNAQIGSRRNLCLVATSLPGHRLRLLLGYASCLVVRFTLCSAMHPDCSAMQPLPGRNFVAARLCNLNK